MTKPATGPQASTASILARLMGANRSQATYRVLEPRVVFDAAGAAVVAEAVQPAEAPAAAPTQAPLVPAAEGAPADDHAELVEALSQSGAGGAVPAARPEVVFIDSAVPDAAALITAVPAGAEVVLLDASRDGVEQIASYLSGRSGVGAIHIISHGEAGELRLGDTRLTGATVAGEHADELAVIRSALSADADILLYGCDVAAGAEGQAFVDALALATGADVGASTDDTGAADLGGDWVLEAQTGAIGASAIVAPEWDNLLAPLTISVSSAPIVTGSGAVGTTAVWLNAGTIGGTAIDLRATVMSLTTLGGLPFFGTLGDDAFVQLTQQGNATLRWEIFAADATHTLSVYAVGTPEFRIADVDGIGGVVHTRESVNPSLAHLTSYTVSTPTNLQVAVAAGSLDASGTQDQNGESTSLVGFVWNNVSSWDVTYTLHINDPFIQARFLHDGDGDFTFVAPATTYLLGIDLDADNSAASGTAYQATFAGTAVPIIDGDVTITQHAALGTTIDSATIVLANAQTGDELLVSGSTAASGTVNGLAYTLSSSGGQITINLSGSATPADYQTALQAITFNNTLGVPSALDRQITVSVTNATYGTTSNEALSTIHVSVNDAPVNTLAAAYTTAEDTTFNLTGLSVADVDADTGIITVTLSVDNGTLTSAGNASVTASGSGTGTLTLTGTLANINLLLASTTATIRPQFVPTPDFNGTVTLTMTTDDSGNTGLGGPLTDIDTRTITVTAVNDRPDLVVPTTIIVTEDVASPITGIEFSDIDAGTGTVIATLAVPAGTLSATTGSGVTVGGTALSRTLTGTLADVNAFIAAGGVTYTTVLNTTTNVVLTATINDNGNTGTDPGTSGTAANETRTATVNLVVDPVDDAPVNTLAATYTLNEDTVLNLTGLSVADVDAGTGIITVTLSVDNGTLTSAGNASVTASGSSTGTLTLTGTLTNINALLASTTATIRPQFVPPADFNGPVTLTMTTDDAGNTGSGGPLTAVDTRTITIAAVNDRPDLTVPVSINVTEDVASPLHDIEFSDIDVGTGTVVATLAVPAGTLAAVSGSGVTVGGTALSRTLTGTLADVNAFIAAGGVTYTTVLNSVTPVTLTVTINDNGNTGVDPGTSGTAANETRTTTVNLVVDEVDDAPVNTLFATYTATEDTVFNITGLSVADVDAGTDVIIVMLSVDSGTLTSAGNANVSVAGSGTSSLTFTGTLADINTLLASATATIRPQFVPPQDFNGTVTLTMTANDAGNSGAGGPLTDIDTRTITVSAVADIVANTVTTTEDTAVNILVLVNDTFESPARYISAIAGTPVVAGDTVTVSNGTAKLNADGTITFTPNADVSGSSVFSYTVTSGGVTETANVTVTITAVADAPRVDLDGSTAGSDFSTTYTQGGAGIPIADVDLAVSDPDTANIASMTVVITDVAAGDVLSVLGTLPTGITAAAYNAAAGILTLTGSRPQADYQTALGQIRFASSTLGDGGRSIAVSVVSAAAPTASNVATATVAITGLDSDSDGVIDDTDIDDDNDGVTDVTEGLAIISTAPEGASGPPINIGPANFVPKSGSATGGQFASQSLATGSVTASNVRALSAGANGLGAIFFSTGQLPAGSVLGDIDLRYSDVTTTNLASSAVVATRFTIGDIDANTYGFTLQVFDQTGALVTDPADFVVTVATSSGPTTLSGPVDLGGGSYAFVLDAVQFASTYLSITGANGTLLSGMHFSLTDDVGASGESISFTASRTIVTYGSGDSDGDGKSDQLDIDADNDGITDNVEAQATGGYIAPTGNAVISDANGDGLDDRYDQGFVATGTHNGIGLTPVDTDSDLITDMFDANSDNVGGNDIVERGDGQPASIMSTADTDGDGLLDIFEGGSISDGFDVNDSNVATSGTTVVSFNLADSDNDVPDTGAGAVGLTADFDYRDNATPIVDLNSTATSTDVDRNVAVTFTEGGAAIAVVGATAGFSDQGEGDVVRLVATLGGFVNGTSEVLTIGGQTFNPTIDKAVTVSGIDITFDQTTQTLTFANNVAPGNPVSLATLQTLIRGMTYVNSSEAPTGANRTLSFVATDSRGNASGPAVATIAAVPVNDAPVDGDETNSVTEDTTLTVANGAAGDLRNNATDVDGGALTITGYTIAGISGTQPVGTPVAIPGVGTITVNADGSYSFAPAANYTGAVPVVTYTVSDGSGGTDTSTLTLSMVAVNDAPVDGDETNSVTEDTTLTVADGAAGDLLNNATDVEGNTHTISAFSVAGQAGPFTVGSPYAISGVGTLTVNANGSYSFAPVSNYTGAIPVVTYAVSDGNGGTDTSTLTLSMVAVNDAPVDGDETNSVTEDTTLTVADGAAGLLANLTDVDGGTPSVTAFTIAGEAGPFTVGSPVAIPGVGAIQINADGSYSFAPVNNYTGAIPVVTYTVSDGNGGNDTATLTLGPIAPVNDPPVAVNDIGAVIEDTPASGNVIGNDSDPDGNPLTVVSYTVPGVGILPAGAPAVIAGVGTLVIAANGAYSFTPAPNYFGPVPVATYTITDGTTAASATLALGPVTNVNDPDTISLSGGPTVFITDDASVSRTFTEDGGPVAVVDPTAFVDDFGENDFYTLALSLSGFVDSGAEKVTIGGAAFTVGSGGSAQVTVGGTTFDVVYMPGFNLVTIEKVGDTPIPVADLNALMRGITYQNTSQDPTAGVRQIGFFANEQSSSTTDFAYSRITVVPVNDAPAGTDATLTTDEDTPYTFSATDFGFTDPADGNALQAVTIVAPPASDTLTLAGVPVVAGQVIPAGDIGQLVYTPAANANGSGIAGFTFTLTDDGGTANGGVDTSAAPNTIAFDVVSVNDAPAGTDATLTTDEDTPYTFSATDFGFTDPADGNALQAVTIIAPPASDTLTLAGVPVVAGQVIPAGDIGQLVYTPAANANGSGIASFTFTATDNGGTANGGVDTSATPNTITFDVVSVNDAPAGTDATLTTSEDTPYTFSATDFGFTDPADGNDLQAVTIVAPPASGTLTLAGVPVVAGQVIPAGDIGLLVYTPASNANGSGIASFTFMVTDDGGTANGGVDTSAAPNTITIDVVAVNDAPVAADDGPFVTDEGRPLRVSVLGNDTDIEGDALRVVAASSGQGSVVISPDGTLAFTSAPGFVGTARVTYTISDGNGGFSTATFEIVVRPQAFVMLQAPSVPEALRALPQIEPLSLDGAVLAAIAGGGSSSRNMFGAGLDGNTAMISANGAILGESSRISRLWHLDDIARAQSDTSPWTVQTLSGSSLRFAAAPLGEAGSTSAQVLIESLVHDGVLTLTFEQTGDLSRRQVVAYRVTRLDGGPLPGWLERPSVDMVQGRPPADMETLRMRVTAVYADGTEASQDVRIETTSGEIQPLSGRRADLAPSLFQNQLRSLATLTDRQSEALAAALEP